MVVKPDCLAQALLSYSSRLRLPLIYSMDIEPTPQNKNSASLLGPDEAAPVMLTNGQARSPVVLVCEHAGVEVPASLSNLGLSAAELHRHIGWDIGAYAVALRLAERLDAPLVAQRYSRLVYDCNRPPQAPDSIPEISESTRIPGNIGISAEARQKRIDTLFKPFDKALATLFGNTPRRAAFSIHSFTPVFHGHQRPWHAGFLSRSDQSTASKLLGSIQTRDPNLTIELNVPYQIDDQSDWFIPQYAEQLGLAHTLVEIRHDLIDRIDGQTVWADHLFAAISGFMETLT